MDHRIALKSNTPLCLCNDRGEVIRCVIENEIGRGGSCIVYEAARVTDTGDKTLYRVKEFYPYKLNISRDENNRLTPSTKDAEVFRQRQEQLRSDFSRTNQLFYSDVNYSSMTNQLDVFRQNGTSYILSVYSSKKTLATYKPETLKECITLVKQVAYVLGNIHKQGYLYLDTKPDNVLVVDGYQKQIQLFDFDSLLSIQELRKTSKLNCSDIRLSYSMGFAPIELQTSKIKRLGPHTDVYSVGALLFYLLFSYTPTAPNCESDAVFDFSKLQYDYNKCDNKLFAGLTKFFQNALAVYYADRYQSMQEVLEQLNLIEKYADVNIPRIFSTKITRPKCLFGREQEFEQLDVLLKNDDYNCLFLTGIGGIGKSAFIREYLKNRNFDTVLYVHYKESIDATISDDNNIEINTIRQDEEVKSDTRYFKKKLQKIRELVRGTNSILVIDNFTGGFDEDLKDILATDLKVVLLTRQAPSYQSSQALELRAISDPASLRKLFEANLGRLITEEEDGGFKELVRLVEGHTLLLELIAKLIANNRKITISSAATLAHNKGVSYIAPEKIDYEIEDKSSKNDTIGNIIDALFEASSLSLEKKIVMKVSSLLGDDGIDINQFQEIMKLTSKDELNELIKDSWLILSDDTISMHRVIQEAIHRWEWTPEYIQAAERFLTYFYVEICLESTKNNYPKKLRNANIELPSELKDKWIFQKIMTKIDKWREKKFNENGLVGKVVRERYARIKDESPADLKKLTKLLFQAENIIKQCQREEVICNTDIYISLHITVLLNMPRYREDYIFSETSQILAENAKAINLGDYAYYQNDIRQDAVVIMRIYELIFSIHAAHRDTKAMKDLLGNVNKALKHFRKREAYAIYYHMVSDYYDILLDGSYDTEASGEVPLRNKMLDAIEKTLHYSKRGLFHDGNHLYTKSILTKVTVLMRSGRSTEKEISDLIDTAKKIIAENTSQYADVRLHYYLVCAWYFVLIHNSAKSADVYVKKARELSDIIIPTDLQKIEEVIIPCANMFFELSCYDQSMTLFCEGIRLCSKHSNTDSYASIKQKLCEHLWEVEIKAQQFELCQKTIERIEAENKEIDNPKNRVVVPDNIRSIITNKTT